MIKYLQKLLGKIGKLELKYCWIFLLLIILFTSFSVVGITKIEIESDFDKFNPQGIPVVDLSDKIDKEFSQLSSFVIIIELDDESNIGEQITDIRDPKVIKFLIELENNLKTEKKVESVFSLGSFFQQTPESLDQSKQILNQIPRAEGLINNAKTVTPIFIDADVGADRDKIVEANEKIQEIVDNSEKPAGIKVAVTGEPPLFAKIVDLILNDGFFTLIASAIAIFVLLFLIERSVKYGLVVIIPVLLGIVWTAGALGWLGIPLTIATAAMGAMLLGLGTEYSIFLNSRYMEEKENMKYDKAIVKALSTTGASTTSSGITTLIGFFALTLSIFPMLGDMGKTFGLGIFFVLSSTMLTGPIVMILEERYERFMHKGQRKKRIGKKADTKALKIFEGYGKIVSHKPILTIIIAIIITGFLFTGISQIKNEEIDFDTILPEDLPELLAFQILENEIEDTTNIVIFIELDQSTPNSNEPIDVRDPRIVNYVDALSQKSEKIDFVVNVRSISTIEKQANKDILPQSLAGQRGLLENLNYQSYITKDFSGTVIRIDLDEDGAFSNDAEVVRQVYEVIKTTKKPIGITTNAAGGLIENYELNKIINPDSGRTAIIAFVAIIIFLFVISRSIKYTILPLITVVVAIIWLLGLIGYLQIGFNSIISSVISMTIGIGIDFGIQLSMRFRQELEENEKREAMINTLKYTLYPMVITVIAALIGFQAMSLGQLKMMQSLGNVLSIGILASMLVAISLVAGLMLVFERKKKKTSME